MTGHRTRKNAYVQYPVGTVFRETDGLYVVQSCVRKADSAYGTQRWDIHLSKASPELQTVYEVMES